MLDLIAILQHSADEVLDHDHVIHDVHRHTFSYIPIMISSVPIIISHMSSAIYVVVFAPARRFRK